MTDARLVATNPETSELVPVAVNAQGQLKTEIGQIELIDNDLTITGDLIVGGTINGEETGGGGGGGLPEPPGTEGQIIQVIDGEPVWVTNENVPKPSTEKIVAVDGSNDFANNNGIFDNDGIQVAPSEGWDAFARTLDCWNVPNAAIQTGISGLSSNRLHVTFDVEINAGTVLWIDVADQSTKSGANANYTGKCTATLSQPDFFEDQSTEFTFDCRAGAENCRGTGSFQWTCTADYIGTLTVTCSSGSFGVAGGPYVSVQSWKLLSPGKAAYLNQAALKSEINELRAHLAQLRVVGPTTDIDQLRRC